MNGHGSQLFLFDSGLHSFALLGQLGILKLDPRILMADFKRIPSSLRKEFLKGKREFNEFP